MVAQDDVAARLAHLIEPGFLERADEFGAGYIRQAAHAAFTSTTSTSALGSGTGMLSARRLSM